MLNRKLDRLGALQNSIDIVSPKPSHGEKVRPVRNQSWGDSSCGTASLEAGIDALGARGDFQRHYGASIGTIDGQVAGPLAFDDKPRNQPEWRL